MREDQHEIDRYLDLVSALGVTRLDLSEARPFMHLNEDDREFARDFLRAAFGNPGNRTIGIQPGTSPAMRWKQWPVDRYRELIRILVSEQPRINIVLFGSPAEAEINRELARGIESNVIVAAGKTSIKQVAALIERCELLICNDSGLMHAAVAVGTPVVAIYGPTDVNRTAPLGQIHSIIRHELPCSPCFKLEGDEQVRTCPHHDCLMTITPGEVAGAVNSRTVRVGQRAP
jgi:lipopolysaccharide heptosyltransferase II